MIDPPLVVAVLFTLALASGFVTQLAGFGGNLVLVPLATLLLPAREAVLLGMLIGLANPLLILLGHHRLVERRPLLIMLVAGLPLSILGMVVHHRAPDAALTLLVAVVALGAGLRKALTRPGPLHDGSGWRLALLPVGGFVQGAVGTSGPLFVAWLSSVIREKGAFRSTLSAFWVCLNPGIVTTLLVTSPEPTVPLVRLLWCLPAVVLAYLLGNRLHHRMRQGVFEALVIGLLLASGLAALAKGLSLVIG